ncbi:MAG: hypothetical protein JXR40_07905 [Pontiellaceae bacterium]|nr:hypothetical protein [Pontiellaceae bacterium]
MENWIYQMEDRADSLIELGPAGALLLALILLFVFFISLIPTLFYLRSLHRAFKRCTPENRMQHPAEVWLLLIPFFNIAWHFVTVRRLAEAQTKEFEQRGLQSDNLSTTKTIGLAMCALTLCTAIPFLGLIAAPVGFICWILYWVKISTYSSKLKLA